MDWGKLFISRLWDMSFPLKIKKLMKAETKLWIGYTLGVVCLIVTLYACGLMNIK
jgi:hypothetical protein